MSDGGKVAQAQAAIREITFELLALQERLEAVNRSLPVPPNQLAMLEDEVTPDLATDVSGCIDCVAGDLLKNCIEILARGSTVTAVELERDFRNRQRKRRRAGD